MAWKEHRHIDSRQSRGDGPGVAPAREGRPPVLDRPPLPVCDAKAGQDCTDPGGLGGKASRREYGHDERVEPIVKEREAAVKAKKAREPEDRCTQRGSASMVPCYRLMKICCPVCNAKPNAECALPAGSHQARLDTRNRNRNRNRTGNGGRRRR